MSKHVRQHNDAIHRPKLPPSRPLAPARADERHTGMVSLWNSGFGFITPAEGGGKDLYVPIREIQAVGVLKVGDRVEFCLGIERDGRIAAQNVKKVDNGKAT